jgi:tol-pal system protein YbgF
MGRIGCVGIGVLCLAVTGCGTNDVILKKQMEMEARLEQLGQAATADAAKITQLTNDLKELQARVNTDAATLDELKQNRREVATSLDSLSQQISNLTAPSTATKIEVVNRETAPADKDAGQQEAYMKAFGLFSADNYPGAIAAFEQYLQNYPQGEYAGNARYWIGECHYTRHDYRSALEAFKLVIKNHPKGAKVPDAMLKIGYSLISLNEPDKARSALEELVEKYPRSPAAAKARERLSHH